ncbi:MAG TPA: CocE/NonD family hydrolase [Streptosporangiaceae bacterium]|nr:CocE/NonD family hydrolase [Streptosporangiaceae bacterium]
MTHAEASPGAPAGVRAGAPGSGPTAAPGSGPTAAPGSGPAGAQAGSMVIERDVPVPMDDGLVLRADVFRPAGEGRYPVILTYGPYAKGLAFQEGYADQWRLMVDQHPDVAAGSSNAHQNWEVVDPEKWVPEGYACVRVDSRGAGRSPGRLDPFSPRETRDLYECIEWAAGQAWSTGKVGLNGISYYAMNQWHVAGLHPPHLAAMCVWEGAADFYRDATHHGGILSTFWGNWYDKQVTVVQHGIGDRGPRNPLTGETVAGPETLDDAELAAARAPFGEQISAHPLDDAFYRERSADYAAITVPLLSAANWGGQGLHTRGNFEGFTQAASAQKWLEVHGLEHWTHFYTDYGVDLQKRFFAQFLHGDDSGWRDQPPVQLQVRTLTGFTQRAEREWPLARTRWRRLYLRPGEKELGPAPPPGLECASYAADGDGVTFSTPPLDNETEITGPLAARLFVSSTIGDADLFLVLSALAPDGTEVTFPGAIDPHTPVAQGWLRMSHRKLDPRLSRPYRPYHSHDQVQPLTPGEIYPADVEIWPTSLVVPAGYRLALTVRGRDYERHRPGAPRLGSFKNELTGCGPFLHNDSADRDPGLTTSTQTLWAGGDRAAYVLLPVIPSRKDVA